MWQQKVEECGMKWLSIYVKLGDKNEDEEEGRRQENL